MLAALALSACASGGSAVPAIDRAALNLAAGQDVVAPSAVLGGISARDLGAAPRNASLELALTLRYRNADGLARLIADQTNRHSSQYRRWLTNAQFNAEFAPSGRDYRTVIASLRAAGFALERQYPNRTVVDVRSNVATAERYFRTTLHAFRQSGYGTRIGNVTPAYAPSELRDVVLNVDGLNTLQVLHADYALATPGHSGRAVSSNRSRIYGPISTQTGLSGYGPSAFTTAYDFPSVHPAAGVSYTGSGRASAIVSDGYPAETDLASFLRYFGVTRTGAATQHILVNGGTTTADVESTLDAEALLGAAPGTSLYIYIVPVISPVNITDAYNRVVSDNKVDSVNSSFGGCEEEVEGSAKSWNALAEQGAAKGVTFHASTGDMGAVCAQAPASSPYVVAIGGTALTVGSSGTWSYEIGWSGSGGGVSRGFALPSWQNGVLGTINAGRNVPDVAFDADPFTGMAFLSVPPQRR
jgi:kumamolisin